jgi:hypothetical protein
MNGIGMAPRAYRRGMLTLKARVLTQLAAIGARARAVFECIETVLRWSAFTAISYDKDTG